MRIGNQRYKVDWGHLLVIAMIAVICAAYLSDTLSTSMRINNILFVLPASIVALLLCLVILPQTIRRQWPDEATMPTQDNKPGEESKPETWQDLGWIALLVAGFGAYVYLMDRIGFDVASWLFITLGLFICGERRIVALLLFPPLAAAVILLGFKALIPYPMYTLIF